MERPTIFVIEGDGLLDSGLCGGLDSRFGNDFGARLDSGFGSGIGGGFESLVPLFYTPPM